MNLSAVILAGGESTRMGQDKAWVKVEGEPLIARALKTVRDLGVLEIFISGRAGTDYSALRCSVLLDREIGLGPLGGIERALDFTQAPLMLVLAVDLPRMTAKFLQTLAQRCDPVTGVIPKLKGQLEPLAAIYPKRCGFIARDCLWKRRLAARDFAEACSRERAVKIYPVPHSDERFFENWNTPSDAGSLQKDCFSPEHSLRNPLKNQTHT
jgi:molybdopterin-guanine dinucleotide biosynthesis protein A